MARRTARRSRCPTRPRNTAVRPREAVAQLRSLPEDKQRDFLVDSGYLVPHWPKPWGRAADVLEQLVIEEEFAASIGRTWASPAGSR